MAATRRTLFKAWEAESVLEPDGTTTVNCIVCDDGMDVREAHIITMLEGDDMLVEDALCDRCYAEAPLHREEMRIVGGLTYQHGSGWSRQRHG